MNSQRLSLSSSVFDGRIKKFDTYQHNSRTSQRVSQNKPVRSPAQNLIAKPVVKEPANTISKAQIPRVDTDTSKLQTVNQKKVRVTQNLALGAVAKSQGGTIAFTKQFNDFQPPALQKARKSKWQLVFYSLGIAVFLFSATVSVQTMLTNSDAREQINVLGEQTYIEDGQGVAEGTGSDPAEEKVSASALANYLVNPELPRYLRIPDIGVNARIKHTGLDKDGSVDAPWNIHDVSWFNEGTIPGSSQGASLLLGHTSGWSGPGVFKNIDKLKVGSRFEVEKGSGEKIMYEVTKTKVLPLADVDMGEVLGPEVAGEHDVKLMTCSGKYNRDTESYADRTIVFAKVLR